MYIELGPYNVPSKHALQSVTIDWPTVVKTLTMAALASAASETDAEAFTGADVGKLCIPGDSGWAVASGGHGMVCGVWYDPSIAARQYIIRTLQGSVPFDAANSTASYARAGVRLEVSTNRAEAIGIRLADCALCLGALRNVHAGLRGVRAATVTRGVKFTAADSLMLTTFDSASGNDGRANVSYVSTSGSTAEIVFSVPYKQPPTCAPMVLHHGVTRCAMRVAATSTASVTLQAVDESGNVINIPSGIRYAAIIAGIAA